MSAVTVQVLVVAALSRYGVDNWFRNCSPSRTVFATLPFMEDIAIEDLIAELNSLWIRVAQLEAGQGAAADTNNGNVDVVALSRGDRIRITKRVRQPAKWRTGVVWDEVRERTATVTRVTRDKIHFVTDNGTRTWRAHNNVRRIGT